MRNSATSPTQQELQGRAALAEVPGTTTFFAEAELSRAISAWFDQAKGADTLNCAVAFWGKGALSLLRENRAGRIRVICNLESGATNPEVVEACLKGKAAGLGHVEIRSHAKLHAKVYASAHGAIVSSANASTNGMGLESAAGIANLIEAGIQTTSPANIAQVNAWFEEVWDRSHKITPRALEKAKIVWSLRKPPARGGSNNSLLRRLLDTPQVFKKKPLYLFIYRDDADANASAQYDEDLAALPEAKHLSFDFFQDCDEIRDDSTVITAYYSREDEVTVSSSLCMLPEQRETTRFRNKLVKGGYSTNLYCYRVPTFEQMRLTSADCRKLESIVPIIIEKERLPEDGGLVPFYKIQRYLTDIRAK